MTPLPGVTLMAADTAYHGATIASMKKSMQKCSFDKVLFFTNIPLKVEGIDIVLIEPLKGKDAYSHFILKEAWKYITTDYVLVVQHDSGILEPDCFDERLYGVDYAGALWLEPDGLCNGNGGFSWRSKRLMEIVGKDDLINATAPEDVALCRVYRRYLEKNYDLIWASDEICEKFSFELRCPTGKVFGFHGRFHEPYKNMVIIQRMAAMGDVIQVEPLLEYFHNKGHRVVLETLPQFEVFFQRHYFPVLFPHQIDPRVLATAKKFNLDMSYESDPQKLHQQVYFEFCGITDYKVRKPKLNLGFEINAQTKMFKKLALLHLDNRSQPHRNIYGVNWKMIAGYLEMKGYTVLQVGRDKTAEIDGIAKMETVNENILAYLCASADLFVGIDSGISHICSGFNVPSVIAFGSVNPEYIHPDMTNIIPIHNHHKEICNNKFCWHSVISVEGIDCEVDKNLPPCAKFETNDFLNAISKLIHE